jgi:hypothetical protein
LSRKLEGVKENHQLLLNLEQHEIFGVSLKGIMEWKRRNIKLQISRKNREVENQIVESNWIHIKRTIEELWIIEEEHWVNEIERSQGIVCDYDFERTNKEFMGKLYFANIL